MERQFGFEASHVARYLLAKSLLKENYTVLDVFCGTGYGSKILALENKVTAFDCYNGLNSCRNLNFVKAEYPNIDFKESFDMIVCFEGIEHLKHELSKRLLCSIRSWLKLDGILLLSTPNLNHYPYEGPVTQDHKFHYTPGELALDLAKAKLHIVEWFNQKSKGTFIINPGYDGRYMIAKCA